MRKEGKTEIRKEGEEDIRGKRMRKDDRIPISKIRRTLGTRSELRKKPLWARRI
jgi:hypothetical protein